MKGVWVKGHEILVYVRFPIILAPDTEEKVRNQHTVETHMLQAMRFSRGGQSGSVKCGRCGLRAEWSRC